MASLSGTGNLKMTHSPISDKAKRLILMIADLVALPIALWASVALRYGDINKDMTAFWFLFPVVAVVGVLAFYQFGLYRAIVRYIGPSAMLPVVQGITIAALTVSLVAYLTGSVSFPRSAPMIFWFIAILLVGGGRMAIRTYFYGFASKYLLREPVAIYGAGESGAQLAVSLLSDQAYAPVAFIDDARDLKRKTIHGIPVFGSRHLGELIASYGIKRVLLAIPGSSPEQRQRILEQLSELPVQVSSVPELRELISGEAFVAEIREVGIDDLLGRSSVPPDESLLRSSTEGKSILVTGAAGTIGSELCRKILARNPRRLVLFDVAEFGLYQIERELENLNPGNVEVQVVLGSILNQSHLLATLSKFEVDTVYHAAAYKHVPMVEQNIVEGIRNNALGTWQVLSAVEASDANRLVMISSDKAVRPTNVMGASKRLAELFVQAFAARAKAEGDATVCSMVRFGNVLKSSGSVVPLFEEQIRSGGPVTVTHPEATRFFMTCEEAGDLVIQAGAMSAGGEIFVLNMGEQVLIKELAEKMIHLHGKRVAGDPELEMAGDATLDVIEIQYTGLRPGEKLREELVIGQNISGTDHPMVMMALEPELSWQGSQELHHDLSEACVLADESKLIELLVMHVNGYRAPAGAKVVDPLSNNVTPLRR